MASLLTPEQTDAFDERKAIMIVDGDIPEDEADAMALISVLDQFPLENNGQMELDLV